VQRAADEHTPRATPDGDRRAHAARWSAAGDTAPRESAAFTPTLRALATLALAALGVASLLTERPHARPSLLLITLDTVRADHCSAYGYARRTTPALEEVARTGTLVEDAYAPMPTTTPSHATLFTGLVPRAHGLLENGDVLVPAHVTLAERLAAAGYQTAAFVSSYVLDRRFGLDQGFAEYDDHMETHRRASYNARRRAHGRASEQDARVTTDKAVAWLRARRDPQRPFFLWIHYFDAHDPYSPPARYAALFRPRDDDVLSHQIAQYDREIRAVDDAVGRLLGELDDRGLAKETLVVIAGDHGEGLMQHGWMHHGLQLYQELLHVPLLLRWPGRVPAGRRLPGPVELSDVLPTVLRLLGVAAPASAPAPSGRSLVAAMRGDAPLPAERPLYFQRRTYRPGSVGGFPVRGPKLAVRVGRWKYIEAPAEGTAELYDLARDPGETVNLVREDVAQASALAERLATWQRTTPAVASATPPLSATETDRLRVLGYVP
jgi:arylsulfatase A-like enzyme